jgi:hypothetical protein
MDLNMPLIHRPDRRLSILTTGRRNRHPNLTAIALNVKNNFKRVHLKLQKRGKLIHLFVMAILPVLTSSLNNVTVNVESGFEDGDNIFEDYRIIIRCKYNFRRTLIQFDVIFVFHFTLQIS